MRLSAFSVMKTKQTILKPFYISALSWAVRFRFVAGRKTKILPANELHQILRTYQKFGAKKTCRSWTSRRLQKLYRSRDFRPCCKNCNRFLVIRFWTGPIVVEPVTPDHADLSFYGWKHDRSLLSQKSGKGRCFSRRLGRCMSCRFICWAVCYSGWCRLRRPLPWTRRVLSVTKVWKLNVWSQKVENIRS